MPFPPGGPTCIADGAWGPCTFTTGGAALTINVSVGPSFRLTSLNHGIGEMDPCCLEFALPDLVVGGGVVVLMAASNLSDSLWLYRSAEPISDWRCLFCGCNSPSFPCLLVLFVAGEFWGLSEMAAVSESILMVSGNKSPVVLAEDSPPIFSLDCWWFFPLHFPPSFSFLVFETSDDGSPWSPVDEMLSIA